MAKSRMYADTATWNVAPGCDFACTYCWARKQAYRQKHNCQKCYDFVPHYHPERLSKIPSASNVFVCGNGDISFTERSVMWSIIAAIKRRNVKHPDQTYLFQSKRPEYFAPFLHELPSNVILGTTLETNELCDYRLISNAPLPDLRFEQLLALDYPRKFITIEPVMDFELWMFADWLIRLKPEHIWIGFDSRRGEAKLPEPSLGKVALLIRGLTRRGIEVRGKDLRGLKKLELTIGKASEKARE